MLSDFPQFATWILKNMLPALRTSQFIKIVEYGEVINALEGREPPVDPVF